MRHIGNRNSLFYEIKLLKCEYKKNEIKEELNIFKDQTIHDLLVLLSIYHNSIID